MYSSRAGLIMAGALAAASMDSYGPPERKSSSMAQHDHEFKRKKKARKQARKSRARNRN